MKDGSHLNNRWDIRQTVALDISLFNGDTEILQTKTENISMSGMFIETPPDEFRVDQDLVVAFSLQTRQGISHHRIPISIVHSTERGAALTFSNYNIETVHMLREFLYADPFEI